jgi:hypothetical protein
MYASIGSYIARSWRLSEFRFAHHPPLWALFVVCVAIYYFVDIRLALFAALALSSGRTWLYYKVHYRYRRMPLLLGLFLVAAFIWIAENFGTLTRTWIIRVKSTAEPWFRSASSARGFSDDYQLRHLSNKPASMMAPGRPARSPSATTVPANHRFVGRQATIPRRPVTFTGQRKTCGAYRSLHQTETVGPPGRFTLLLPFLAGVTRPRFARCVRRSASAQASSASNEIRSGIG